MPRGAPNLEYGRLGILAAAIIVVLLLGYLLVRLLSGGGGIPASQQYFNDLRPIIRSSNAAGNDFHTLMIKRGVPVNQFVAQLTEQMNTSQDVVNKAARAEAARRSCGRCSRSCCRRCSTASTGCAA